MTLRRKLITARFLLAKLHFTAVSSQLRLKTVRKALSKLPSDVNDTYDDTLERILKGQKREQSELAMSVLMILTMSFRPLSVKEVQHALLTMELEEDEGSIDINDIYEKEMLLNICGGLVVIEAETGAMRFVHHTAEDYFESHSDKLFQQSARSMANICLTYISMDEFKSGPCGSDEDFEKRRCSYPLYEYASSFLGIHLGPEAYDKKILELFESKTLLAALTQALVATRWHRIQNSHSQNIPIQTPLHAAAASGLLKVMQKLITDGHYLDSQEGCGVPPLGWAILRGRPDAARALINLGADINLAAVSPSPIYKGRTPLHFAAVKGYEDLVSLLLQRGADVNARVDASSLGKSRFEVEKTDSGSVYYVDHLYRRASWIDPRSKRDAANPKICSVAMGMPSDYLHPPYQSQLLVQSPSPSQYLYQLPAYQRAYSLQRSSTYGIAGPHEGRVVSGPTALSFASLEGHLRTVEVLLEAKGVDANAKDAEGRTPLALAASNGHTTVAETILGRHEVNADAQDFIGRTALSHAAANNYVEVVTLLLNPVTITPCSGGVEGQESGQKLVWRPGRKVAYVNHNDSGLPLGWTEEEPNTNGVALYRDHIRDVSAQTNPLDLIQEARSFHGNTPLMYAAKAGQNECVEMLLKFGSEADARDVVGRTALTLAARYGHLQTVRLLLQSGANAAITDIYDNTPGFYAVKNGHKDVGHILSAWDGGGCVTEESLHQSRKRDISECST